jgi:hypothetical protein
MFVFFSFTVTNVFYGCSVLYKIHETEKNHNHGQPLLTNLLYDKEIKKLLVVAYYQLISILKGANEPFFYHGPSFL